MKTLVLMFGLLVLMGSCKKETIASNNACVTANPLENVTWMKDLKASIDTRPCVTTLFQATYQHQTVYFETITDTACEYISGATSLLDCSGQIIKTYTAKGPSSFATEVTGLKELYVSHR